MGPGWDQSLSRNCLCNFGKGTYEEHYCEIILNSTGTSGSGDAILRFLFLALEAILFGRAELFVQF